MRSQGVFLGLLYSRLPPTPSSESTRNSNRIRNCTSNSNSNKDGGDKYKNKTIQIHFLPPTSATPTSGLRSWMVSAPR